MKDIFKEAYMNNVDCLKIFLKDNSINSTDQNNQNLLHHAVKGNALQVMDLLFLRNIAINHQDKYGESALFTAISYNKFEMVSILLTHGANANLRNKNHETPLACALLKGNCAIIDLLIKYSDLNLKNDLEQSLLFYAVRSNDIVIFKKIFRFLSDFFQEVDVRQQSLLHYTAKVNNLAILEYLIKNNIKLHRKDKMGETAIFWAARYSSREFFHQLILYGAIVEGHNYHQETIYDIALKNENSEIIDYLESLNYVQFYQIRKREYPLHIAVIKEDINEAEELINKGINKNKKDEQNCSPLDYAIDLKNQYLISLLKLSKNSNHA